MLASGDNLLPRAVKSGRALRCDFPRAMATDTETGPVSKAPLDDASAPGVASAAILAGVALLVAA